MMQSILSVPQAHANFVKLIPITPASHQETNPVAETTIKFNIWNDSLTPEKESWESSCLQNVRSRRAIFPKSCTQTDDVYPGRRSSSGYESGCLDPNDNLMKLERETMKSADDLSPAHSDDCQSPEQDKTFNKLQRNNQILSRVARQMFDIISDLKMKRPKKAKRGEEENFDRHKRRSSMKERFMKLNGDGGLKCKSPMKDLDISCMGNRHGQESDLEISPRVENAYDMDVFINSSPADVKARLMDCERNGVDNSQMTSGESRIPRVNYADVSPLFSNKRKVSNIQQSVERGKSPYAPASQTSFLTMENGVDSDDEHIYETIPGDENVLWTNDSENGIRIPSSPSPVCSGPSLIFGRQFSKPVESQRFRALPPTPSDSPKKRHSLKSYHSLETLANRRKLRHGDHPNMKPSVILDSLHIDDYETHKQALLNQARLRDIERHTQLKRVPSPARLSYVSTPSKPVTHVAYPATMDKSYLSPIRACPTSKPPLLATNASMQAICKTMSVPLKACHASSPANLNKMSSPLRSCDTSMSSPLRQCITSTPSRSRDNRHSGDRCVIMRVSSHDQTLTHKPPQIPVFHKLQGSGNDWTRNNSAKLVPSYV